MSESTVVHLDHPLIQHKLTIMRQKDTPTAHFRRLLREISMLMGYEVTRDLPLHQVEIETPLEEASCPLLAGRKMAVVSILRAGDGIAQGMLEILPSARMGHVGLYRDPKTLIAVEYYFKMPADIPERDVVLVDPMLATGHSAVAAVERVKSTNPKSLKFLCLLAAPEGIEHFHEHHPDVPIYVAAVDRELNEKGYILPGLGDAGDRIFGPQ
jgi:uracil phosphoribosyltransferase